VRSFAVSAVWVGDNQESVRMSPLRALGFLRGGGRRKEQSSRGLHASHSQAPSLCCYPASHLSFPPFQWILTVVREVGVEYCDGLHSQTELRGG
jgi:hypothetical protein